MKRGAFLHKLLLTIPLVFAPSFLKAQPIALTKDEFAKALDSAKTLKELSNFLESLTATEKMLKIEGAWSIGTVLAHCGQSIQYSITGYPEMKSAAFRSTIGSVVFSVFSYRGKMSHGLEEPIPGAEKLDLQISFADGKKRLLEAIAIFESKKSEDLKPHFAYGTLDKQEYDGAHTLHIKNHFQRISIL